MEGLFQAKKLIDSAQNILILTSKNANVDSLGSALSLSYTLNNANKIVNFFPPEIPKKFSPLFPSRPLPEKFIISIKGKEISELYYEKKNQILNIFLSSKSDKIKEEDVKFVAVQENDSLKQEADLLVSVGVERLEKLGSFYEKNFKLFYQTPILNIDNKPLNNKFGNTNLIFENLPISTISAKLISVLHEKTDQNINAWLLAGIIDFSQKKKITQETLESVFNLSNWGLDYQKIIAFFLPKKPWSQTKLLEIVLKKIELYKDRHLPFVFLAREDFKLADASPKDLGFILKQLINNFFHLPSLLLLWESNSLNGLRGVFYSSDNNEVKKIAEHFRGKIKGKGIIFNIETGGPRKAKEEIMRALS